MKCQQNGHRHRFLDHLSAKYSVRGTKRYGMSARR
jgi:hypothetical protein